MRDTVLTHRNSIDRVRAFHCGPIVGNDDKLSLLAQRLECIAKATDVGLVEHGVYFVEDAKWSGGHLKNRKQKRGGGK